MIEFVGFRGYYKNGHPIIDLEHTMETQEIRDTETNEIIEIEKVYAFKHPYHDGQAHPAPIDEKNVEWGILPHEVEAFHLIRRYLKTGIMFKWPRGFGKTFIACWFIEWSMIRLGYPWAYFSETAIMNDVAFWIWQWAQKTKQVKNVQRGDKQNTYTQFELNNGAVLRIYRYLDEKFVGQHGWYLAFDDIIKKSWSERPSDVKKAKNQWNYSISKIRRKGIMIFGTRKFDGDPLEHLEKTIKNIHIEVRTPYIMEGSFPDWVPKVDASSGREVLWVPELYTYDELEDKKVTPTEDDTDPWMAWMAEMMQDPRPMEGGMVTPDDIEYVNQPFFADGVQMVGIGVDLSWEDQSESSDMCGIVSCVMNGVQIEKKWYKRFTFIKADVKRMPLYDRIKEGKLVERGVFTIITEHFKYLQLQYPGIPMIIAIERNGGGVVVIKVAQRENFKWLRYCLTDKHEAVKLDRDGKVNVKMGITHSKNKVARVYGELQSSIEEHEHNKGHETRFEWKLDRTTEFMKQLLAFPKGKHDDGPDCGGMIKDELRRKWKSMDRPKPRENWKEKQQKARNKKNWEQQQQPWLKGKKSGSNVMGRRKRII